MRTLCSMQHLGPDQMKYLKEQIWPVVPSLAHVIRQTEGNNHLEKESGVVCEVNGRRDEASLQVVSTNC